MECKKNGDFSKETGIFLGNDLVIWAKNAFLQPITLPGLTTVTRLVIFKAIIPIYARQVCQNAFNGLLLESACQYVPVFML